MTTAHQAKILQRIADLSGDIESLRRVRIEIAAGGTASASLSAGGGSKSYTRLDLNTVSSLIRELEAELRSLRNQLHERASIRRIYCVR